jgi:hypothetical protein
LARLVDFAQELIGNFGRRDALVVAPDLQKVFFALGCLNDASMLSWHALRRLAE